VGRDGRGVLLVGRGGSGKSTLALSCALAGMEVAADDYVLLEMGLSPLAHAMQSTAKLTEDSVARLGLGGDAIDPAGFEPTLEGPAKALVEIRTLAPGAMVRHLEISAVVAPVGNGSGGLKPTLRLVSGAQGLRAVAPSTIVQSGFQGGSSLAALADLVRRVPSYELELSSDPASNAATVRRLVEDLG
jgi:energy-coupling factor transporter ATP-binding protein EcfA2